MWNFFVERVDVARPQCDFSGRNNWSFQHPGLQAVPAMGSPLCRLAIHQEHRVENTQQELAKNASCPFNSAPSSWGLQSSFYLLETKVGWWKHVKTSWSFKNYLSTWGCFHIGKDPDWAGIKLILASPPCRISNQICPSLSHWRESTRVARSSGHSLEKKVVLDLVVVILVLVRSLVKDYTVTIAKSGNFWKLLKSVYRRDQEMLAESERNIANPFDWPSGESAVISSR